ncbi:MAG: hypothetical protein U5L11_17210 [Arhodomonas sp.]|nr:hypothetical protein [Arhodomonas sp.]
MIELPGFVVNILEPAAAQKLSNAETDEVAIRANVMMMCGCPIEPGGLWDADRYEVVATVRRNGEVIAEEPLRYAGTASHFEGEIPVTESGALEVTVHAYDPHNGNTGVDTTTMVVQ